MGKYDPLGTFLKGWRRRKDAEGVKLRFTHIEHIIGGLLPRGQPSPNGGARKRAPTPMRRIAAPR